MKNTMTKLESSIGYDKDTDTITIAGFSNLKVLKPDELNGLILRVYFDDILKEPLKIATHDFGITNNADGESK